jgi:FkbM family methyltransferase
MESIDDLYGYDALEILRSDVCLDLGANIGAWTCLALSKGAKVISMEPEPSNFWVLYKNAPDAEKLALAVAGHAGEVELNITNFTMRHSLKQQPYEPTVRTVRTRAVTLKDVVDRYNPTVIKCDIEGSEHDLDWTCLSGVRELAVEIHYLGARQEDWFSAVSNVIHPIESQGLIPLHTPYEIAWEGKWVHSKVGVWTRRIKPI